MPNSYTRISNTASQGAIVNQINNNFQKLDAEAVTKKFGSDDNTVIIGKIGEKAGTQYGDISKNGIFTGRYAEDRFATIYYQNGVPIILDGQAPDDGRMGKWQVKPGKNVITELGG